MIYLTLFYEFFKIGLFAVGGGLATLPFLSELANKYDWFDASLLSDMIAISESTPGPIGVNMATYAGIQGAGILGGIVATLSLIAPSVIVVLIVAKFLQKFRDSYYVDSVFKTLRPAVTALIAYAGIGVLKSCILNLSAFASSGNLLDLIRYKELIFFAILIFVTNKWKAHPIAYILISAVVGIVLKMG